MCSLRIDGLLTAVSALLLVSSAASGGPISSIVVYGDSLSDNGNYFALTGKPQPPYYMGRQSNGPVAVEQMAQNLGVPLVDYAYIGATTGIGDYDDTGGTTTNLGPAHIPGMLTELADTPNSVSAHPGALFIVWGGANDFLAPSPLDTTPQAILQRAVGDLLTIVGTLKAEGATNILVPGLPDVGLTPYYQSLGSTISGEASALTNAFNAALVANLPAGVTYVDTADLLRAVVADPGLYGFSNAEDACYNGVTVCADPGQYLFFDSFHPTTQLDSLVAQEFVDVVIPEPGTAYCAAGGLMLVFIIRRKQIFRRL